MERDLAAWRIVKLVNPDVRAGAIRIRISSPEPADPADYATAVEITWGYEGRLPSSQDRERQSEFEAALDELRGHNAFSELVQVRTGFGAKDWLFYTTDRGRFMRELNRALESHPRYPIKIAFYDDPDWAIWRETVDDITSHSQG